MNCQRISLLEQQSSLVYILQTISYATGRSNILNVIQGTYKPSIKPAFIPSTNKRPAEGQDEMGEDNQRPGKRAREAAEQEEEEEEGMHFIYDNFLCSMKISHRPLPHPEEHETNRILFVSNLPPTGVTEAALAELFEPYSGFKEVRLVPGKPMAFVEYDSVESARSARTVLHGFQISPDHKILVEFAKA